MKLVFDGRAFPSARVSRRILLQAQGDPLDILTVNIEPRSTGRRWSTEKPLAFWRTYAEADPSDIPPVLDMVFRYGDPEGILRPGMSAGTDSWYRWTNLLLLISHAWGKADQDGISRVHDHFIAEEAANAFMRDRQLFDVRLDLDLSLQPVARAARLGDFMLASAAFMLADKTPMRQCAVCGHWTEASHAATRYCSNACRLVASRLKKEA